MEYGKILQDPYKGLWAIYHVGVLVGCMVYELCGHHQIYTHIISLSAHDYTHQRECLGNLRKPWLMPAPPIDPIKVLLAWIRWHWGYLKGEDGAVRQKLPEDPPRPDGPGSLDAASQLSYPRAPSRSSILIHGLVLSVRSQSSSLCVFHLWV